MKKTLILLTFFLGFIFGKEYLLFSDNNEFLGCLNCGRYQSDSVCNKYGTYGSKYNSKSIWNKYGTYGGKYSLYSPFNKYTSTPPTFYTTSNKTGKLTVNESLTYAFNPYRVKACFP